MNYKINKYILNQEILSYATEKNFTDKYIDCYDGINNLSFPSNVKEAFDNLDYSILKSYPRGNNLKDAIINYYSKYVNLNYDNIVFTEGSIGGIYFSNRLFLEINDKVLGYIPQFAEYALDAEMYGAKFDYYTLKKENNYKFDEDEFIKMIDSSYKLIYLDNPNNPTGQIITIDRLEKIIKVASENDVMVIIDEAYGDYMDINNSAINLLTKYPNIIVLKTFSKCYSMAGIRAGYMIVPPTLSKYIAKFSHPYYINSLAREMAAYALDNKNFIKETIQLTKNIKSQFLKEYHNLRISYTDNQVPIFLVEHQNNNINLEKEFAKFNIKVVGGDNYLGLNKNAVRIKIPSTENVSIVLDAFDKIDNLI